MRIRFVDCCDACPLSRYHAINALKLQRSGWVWSIFSKVKTPRLYRSQTNTQGDSVLHVFIGCTDAFLFIFAQLTANSHSVSTHILLFC